MNKEEINQYLLINHWYMTITEMSVELNIPYSSISNKCKELEISAITIRERMEEFIKAHQDWTVEDTAEYFHVQPCNIYPYMKGLGISLKTRGQNERKEKELKKEKDKHDISPINKWSKEHLDYINALTGYKKPGDKKIKRISEPYTQSGSQFTDELRGIKTTERIK